MKKVTILGKQISKARRKNLIHTKRARKEKLEMFDIEEVAEIL